MLKLSLVLNFFLRLPNLFTKDLTLIWIHMVMGMDFSSHYLTSACFQQSVMKSVLGLLTFGLFLGALRDRYCKHPTLSAVETKKAGRRLFTLPALEIVWRARMKYCIDCISDNLYFMLYIMVSVNKWCYSITSSVSCVQTKVRRTLWYALAALLAWRKLK